MTSFPDVFLSNFLNKEKYLNRSFLPHRYTSMKYVTRPAPPPPVASTSGSSGKNENQTKQKPPRPPPPVMKQKQNFSNLFGGKADKSSNMNMEVRLPPVCFPNANAKQANKRNDVQLINFFDESNTDGSEKDSVSIDSFCSNNSSSPHNFNSGTQSQTERYVLVYMKLASELI
jgi:hypothetical protein